MNRRLVMLTVAIGAFVALVAPAGATRAVGSAPAVVTLPSHALPTAADRPPAARKRKAAPRRGGTVRAAWPRKPGSSAPRSPLARWLARRVGPPRKRSSGTTGSRGLARAASSTPPTLSSLGDLTSGSLALVRSFDIPTTDAAYNRLKNLSWTYDNALAVMAFLDVDEKGIAEQLLDQLMALQRTDGSLDFAYDVTTGAGSTQIRSNAMAWAGIAAVRYRRENGSTRYDKLIAGIANYLLGLRTTAGLVNGGPDVSWVSTQHNLLTDAFLRDLISSLKSKSMAPSLGVSSTTLSTAEAKMAGAILSTLLVQSGSQAYFVEGVGDSKIPLDVQAFGAMSSRSAATAAPRRLARTSRRICSRRRAPRSGRRCSGSARSTAPGRRTSSGRRARSRPLSRSIA